MMMSANPEVSLHGKTLKLKLLPKTSSGSGGASSNTAAQELELPSRFFAEVSQEKKNETLWGKSSAIAVLKETPLRPEFSKILEGVFEASPFGHGGQTVLDDSVRKAMQVCLAAAA